MARPARARGRRPAIGRAELPALVPGLLRLGRVDLFEGLPPDEVAALDARLRVVRWLYGAPQPRLLALEDHLFVVREGRLALFERTRSGQPIIIALLEPGAVYSSLGDVPAPSLDALCDSAVSPIPSRALEMLIARYPRLGRNLAEAFSERVAMLREVAAVLGEIRVEDRLRARLRQVGTRVGRMSLEGVRIPLELTHAQWALLVGASRESVTLALGRLRARGEIAVEGRVIILTGLAADLVAPPAGAPAAAERRDAHLGDLRGAPRD